MKRLETDLPDVCVIEPEVHSDHRGFFMESYNVRSFAQLGITTTFVQDNVSGSRQGVLRGLHYQLGQPQAKLVSVVSGEVFDVAVDVRYGSPTFGKWVGMVLSRENRRMLMIPEGFAHGFYVLSRWAEFSYKCSNFYAPDEQRGIVWNDPDLGIDWPSASGTPIVSKRDAALPRLGVQNADQLPSYTGVAT
ncbi:MAG: dTDP-4-dehydrorhamnose 3,5-epimerase [Phycisphaerae bacterium]|nr:dTDP-4-dehydrorhamnose 3,5-epimerase [Phycisphaerae bacterium]